MIQMKTVCLAVMIIAFIWLVANFQTSRDMSSRVLSLVILLIVVSGILSSTKQNLNMEPFVAEGGDNNDYNEILKRLKKDGEKCSDRRVVSLGVGYHPISDVPACVNDDDMFIFSKSRCTPECCDFGKNSGFSCSTGCVCKE